MDSQTEKPRNLGFVLSEAEFGRSRDQITIASGQGVLSAGTVLGIVTASGHYAASPNAETVGVEGAETAKAVLAYAVDATSAAVPGVAITRASQVKSAELLHEASVNDATKTAAKATQLAAAGIIVR